MESPPSIFMENNKKLQNPFELPKVRKVLEIHVLDLLVPVRVTLFYAEGVYGSVSGVDYPELAAGLHDGSVHSHKRFVGNVKLPSKFTNETHTKCKNLTSTQNCIILLWHPIWIFWKM